MTTRFLGYPLTLAPAFATFASTPVHVEMLRDGARTSAFERAIKATVQPGDRVVDIGAGSGLLGLWALEAGAARLDGIDATEIGDTLSRTFAANGVADKAQAHRSHSRDVVLEPADVIIAEVLGHYGIDEGILPTCADARRRLAKPEARFIPARVDVMAWPVWVPDFENDLAAYWQSRPYGFDLTAMADLTRTTTYLCGEQCGQRLAEPVVVSRHVIGEPSGLWQARGSFSAAFKSQHNGFFLSFTADLGGGVQLDGWRTSSWMVVFLPAPKVTTLARGDVVTLEIDGNQDGSVRYRVSS